MENAFGQPQNVVVLGGSSDIARAITKKLCAARTHTVVLAGRSQGLLDEAAREAHEYGATKTDVVLFDAEDPSNAEATVNACFDKVDGPVDLVIIAVGLLGEQLAMQDDPTQAARMMTVNMTWPVAALAQLRRRLVAQGSGRILVISSVASVRTRPSMYLYSGAKAGLDRLCDAMADSLEGTGVSLQLLRPGVVRTKMTIGILKEAPFTTGPNEVAEYVMKGLTSGKRVIWSPPPLEWVFAILRHTPRKVWLKIMER
jgi:decaprenylphospho-beta-D-erythro-pentofuranosid-2-ulose 2-reductase